MEKDEYRAWDEKENRMEYCPGVKRMEDWLSPDINALIKHCQKYEGYILMQYTGLNDKNDRKIWDGDIIGYYDAIGEVYFEDGAFLVRDDHCEGDLLSDWMAGERLVIGNIYENPELLEGN